MIRASDSSYRSPKITVKMGKPKPMLSQSLNVNVRRPSMTSFIELSSATTGQASRKTQGGVYCQGKPASGKCAPGCPTVSPIVKYTSCGAG